MSMQGEETGEGLPGQGLDYAKMPGHWLLAQMGKRVLRPGGLELSRKMLAELDAQAGDDVVEFAPGLGVTARIILERDPASYTGIERSEEAAAYTRGYLSGQGRRCIVGRAESPPLPDDSASVVFGEAMLTMQTAPNKGRIVREAARLLTPGGRYGIHELCLQPDDIGEDKKAEINKALSGAIRVGARPLTPSEWVELLEESGFAVNRPITAPMHLLQPKRFVQDEGLAGALRFALKAATTPAARRRILGMRKVFRQYADNLAAIALVGVKQAD